MYALDTNSIIYSLKDKGDVRQRLQDISPQELAVPAVVLYELQVGTLHSSHQSRRAQDLHRLLRVLTVLPFDRKSAECAALIRTELEKAGVKIGPIDTLIAGTAIAHQAILVSHNMREFVRIAGLQVEDWF